MAGAYGWPPDLDIAAILEPLVALNRERAEEEKRGLIRGLWPELQAPCAKAVVPVQEEMAVGAGATAWPRALPEQFQAVARLLDQSPEPVDAKRAARSFKGAKPNRVEELLRTLVALGQARALPDRRYGR